MKYKSYNDKQVACCSGCKKNLSKQQSFLQCMVLTFAAFDRDLYQKFVPNHIADSYLYPSQVLDLFKSGGLLSK